VTVLLRVVPSASPVSKALLCAALWLCSASVHAQDAQNNGQTDPPPAAKPAAVAKSPANAPLTAASGAVKTANKPAVKATPVATFVMSQAAPAPVQASGLPHTRMQRCLAELADVTGDARKQNLRECLSRRVEGERILGRDCERQVREVPSAGGLDKHHLHRQCLDNALQASYVTMPKRVVQPATIEVLEVANRPTTEQALDSLANRSR
jgi:hypothetical protein